MTTMNPLSDQFLAVESLIFSRSTIEFYRNGGTLPHELPPITFLWVQQPLLWACHPSWGLVVAGQQWEQPHLRLRSTCCASWLFFHHTITIPAVSFGSSVPMHLFLPLSFSFYLSKNLHPRKQQIVGWTSLAIFYSIFAENWKKKKKRENRRMMVGIHRKQVAKICLTTILFWQKTMWCGRVFVNLSRI